MTHISVIDSPCGYGKSTGLINELKRHRINNPSAQILVVVPELGEVDRFLNEIGAWFYAPEANIDDTNSGARTKSDSIIQLLSDNKNIVTTHALYKRIRGFL